MSKPKNTVVTVKVEFPDLKDVKIVPEEGTSEKEYTDAELQEARDEWLSDLVAEVNTAIENSIKKELIEENIMDGLECSFVEGYESLEDDFGVIVEVKIERV